PLRNAAPIYRRNHRLDRIGAHRAARQDRDLRAAAVNETCRAISWGSLADGHATRLAVESVAHQREDDAAEPDSRAVGKYIAYERKGKIRPRKRDQRGNQPPDEPRPH